MSTVLRCVYCAKTVTSNKKQRCNHNQEEEGEPLSVFEMIDVKLETVKLLNEVGIDRKMRVALLVGRCGLSWEAAAELVGPEDPSDY